VRKWLTIGEAADHFKISAKTLYSLVGRGRLPKGSVLRLGRQIRIDVAAVENTAEDTVRK
jgi:excisionase family DNA binding protein